MSGTSPSVAVRGIRWRSLDRQSVCLVVALVMAYFVAVRLDNLSGTLRVLFPTPVHEPGMPQLSVPATVLRLEVAGLVIGLFQLLATLFAGWDVGAPRRWSWVALVTALGLGAAANLAAAVIAVVSQPTHSATPYLLAAMFHGVVAVAVGWSRPVYA